MLLQLRVQNKWHQKPLSRPKALQENPAEACFWKSQDGFDTLPQPCRAFQSCIPPLSMALWNSGYQVCLPSPRASYGNLLNRWRKLMHCRCLAAMTGRVQIM